jgi:secreted trypsin-like serine protease
MVLILVDIDPLLIMRKRSNKELLLFLLMCFLTCTTLVSCDLEIIQIAGGREATLGELPYAVGIKLKTYSFVFCGGALITNRYILSAAHCFEDEPGHPGVYTNPDNLEIVIGRVNLDDNAHGGIYKVKRFLRHESYNPSTMENDIAIVELKNNITLNEDVNILIPNNNDNIALNTMLTLNGWGYIDSNENYLPRIMRTVNVPLVPGSNCERHGRFNSTSMLCAGLGQGKDSCAGDSGGSLTYKNSNGIWIGVGIVSFGGIPCGGRNVIGTYTKVSYFTRWLLSNVPDLNMTEPDAPAASSTEPSPIISHSIPVNISGINLPQIEIFQSVASSAISNRLKYSPYLCIIVCVFLLASCL